MLLGCDFSSSPSVRKSIVLAWGQRDRTRVRLQCLARAPSLADFFGLITAEPRWLGGFDLPFGLPRELVQTLGWPEDWQSCIRHFAALEREQIRVLFRAFCAGRPVGGKFAHRATDIPAGSSPSMKWVNPPVAFMLHAGVPLLLDAGAHFPGLQGHSHRGTEPARVALEAYPGLLAREVLGRRSYKSDSRAGQTTERLLARKDLVNALELGQTRLGLRLVLTHAQRDALVDDASGDALDAVLCLLQAAWADDQHANGHPDYGLPQGMDVLEGWIVTA